MVQVTKKLSLLDRFVFVQIENGTFSTLCRIFRNINDRTKTFFNVLVKLTSILV